MAEGAFGNIQNQIDNDTIGPKQTSPDISFARLEHPYQAGQNLKFPRDLTSKGGYIFFRAAKEYKFKRQEITKKETQATVFLPLPNNLATAYNAQYSSEGIGPVGNFAAGAVPNLMNSSVESLIEKLKGTTQEDIKGNVKSMGYGALNLIAGAGPEQAAVLGAILGNAAGGVVGATLGSAIKGGLAGVGVARNPHLATLFQGTNFRSHQFQYKLVASNEQESNEIANIISIFKYHMLPSYAGENHFFNYPEQFDIEIVFPGEGHKYSFDIGASVLKDFTVDYTGEGAPYFFESGAPASVTIGMTFEEVTITTKENIKQPFAGSFKGR